jgi:hypothetical protein
VPAERPNAPLAEVGPASPEPARAAGVGKARLSLMLQGGAFVSVAAAPQSGPVGVASLETPLAPALGLALATQYEGRVT